MAHPIPDVLQSLDGEVDRQGEAERPEKEC
jgi:hypothetical protein